jgi:hypothetical protein
MAVDPLADMALTESHKAVVRRQLTQLAAQADRPELRDMARDVLAGKVDLRGAMLSSRYEDVLNEGMSRFSTWYQNLTSEERTEQVRRAEDYAAEVRKELLVGRRPRPEPTVEEDWVSRPILRKRRNR